MTEAEELEMLELEEQEASAAHAAPQNTAAPPAQTAPVPLRDASYDLAPEEKADPSDAAGRLLRLANSEDVPDASFGAVRAEQMARLRRGLGRSLKPAPGYVPPADPKFEPLTPENAASRWAITAPAKQAPDEGEVADTLKWIAENDGEEPGKRAEVVRYSAASGLSADFVANNFDTVKARVDSEKTDWVAVAREQPALAQYVLEKPEVAPLVREDLKNLSTMEWLFGKFWEDDFSVKGRPDESLTAGDFGAPAAALWDAVNQQRTIWKQYRYATQPEYRTPENEKEIQQLEESFTKDYGANNFITKGLIAPFKMAPLLVGDMLARAGGKAIGSGVGGFIAGVAGAGATAPEGGAGALPAAPAGTALGGKVGELAGSFLYNYYESIGPTYWHLSQVRDANGNALEPEVVEAFAKGGAIITAGLMAGAGGPMVKSLPGARYVIGKVGATAVERALAEQTTAQAAKRGLMSLGKHALTGAVLMSATGAANAAATEGAKGASNKGDFQAHWGNVGTAAKDGFVNGLEDMWLLSLSGAGQDVLADLGKARAVADFQVRHEKMAKAVEGSALLDKAPQQAEELLGKMAGGKQVYSPVEAWNSYWQDQKVDPGEMAAAVMGDGGKGYAQAAQNGGELAIPAEKFWAKLGKTEHARGLADDVKSDPELNTPRQQRVEEAAQLERLKKAAEERKDELSVGKKAVHDFIYEQAVGAGVTKADAEANAKLAADNVAARAVAMGVPMNVAAAHGNFGQLRILGPAGEAVAQAAREKFKAFLGQGEEPTREIGQGAALQQPGLAGPALQDALRADLAGKTDEEAAAAHYLDPVSGLRDVKAFEQMPVPEGKAVAVITTPSAKGINDHPTLGGHNVTNDLLREVGRPLSADHPEAARSGTNFLIHVDIGKEREQLDAAIRKVKEGLNNPNLDVIGASGATTKAAFGNLKTSTTERRAAEPEHPDFIPPKGALRPGLDVAAIKTSPERAKSKVPEELVQRVRDRSEEEHFATSHLDHISYTDEKGRRVSAQTGLLSAEAMRSPRTKRAHSLAIDLRGLGSMPEAVGDRVLIAFAQAAAHLAGAEFVAGHLSGDEFEVRHDSREMLERYGTVLKSLLDANPVTVEIAATGELVDVPILFRHGTGPDYSSADRSLNAKRIAEAEAAAKGVVPGVHVGPGEREALQGGGDRGAGQLELYQQEAEALTKEAQLWREAQRSTIGSTQAPPITSIEGVPVTLEQDGATGPRGEIRFQVDPSGKPRSFDIHLLNGDKSTLAHELSHFLSWSMHDLAGSALATPEMKEDYASLIRWMGYDSGDTRVAETKERSELSAKTSRTPAEEARLKALSAKEERISHGFEQYLAEGKAPNKGQSRTFSRFRDWMGKLYKGVVGIQQQYKANFGQELAVSDEVRGIFDRMFTEDTALARARKESGSVGLPADVLAAMSPTERAAHQKTLDDAKVAAEQRIAELTAELRAGEGRVARERIVGEVTAEVDQQPLYRAQRFLQHGELPDAEGARPGAEGALEMLKGMGDGKLNRPEFVKEHGKEMAQRMPPGVFHASKDKGATTDQMAALLGFDDGPSMVLEFLKNPTRDSVIAEQTKARVDAELAPVMKAIGDSAMDAVHTEAEVRQTLTELRALAKRASPEAARRVNATDIETLKRTAKGLVADKKVSELNPAQHARNERKAALEVARLWGAGEKEKALAAGEQRLFNQLLYIATRDAHEEMGKAQEKLANVSDGVRANLGKADPAYRDVHDALAAAVGLGEAPAEGAKTLDQLVQLADADAQQLDFDVDAIRQLIATPKDFESLTVDEARNVADAATNIRHLARKSLEVDLAGKRLSKEALLKQMAEHVASVRKPLALLPPGEVAKTFLERARGAKRLAATEFENIETISHYLDGGDAGPFHDLLVDSRLKARDKEVELTHAVLKKVREAYAKLPASVRKLRGKSVDLGGTVLIPGNFDHRYTRDQLWSLFLNSGNEGNLQRLRDGNKLADADRLKALSLLTKPETDFLQGLLDAVQSLHPALAAAHEERTGLPMGKVEASEIEVNGQKYRGGYFPLKYRSETRPGQLQEVNEIKDLRPSNAPPATESGHRKSREDKVNAPLDLEFGLVQAHLANVIHDIAYGDWVKQTAGVILKPRTPTEAPSFSDTVERFIGKEREKQIVPWLRDVASARSDSMSQQVATASQKLGAFARGRLALGAMGFNLPVLLRHSLDGYRVLKETEGIPIQRVAYSYMKVINPLDWGKYPEFEQSKEIAYHHAKHADNLRQEMNNISGTLGKFSDIQEKATRVAFGLQLFLDQFTTRVAFKAAYDDAINRGFSQEEAVKRGDDVLRRAFPSGDIAEKPPIMRSKTGWASSLMFYGWGNSSYNMDARAFDDAERAIGSTAPAGDKVSRVVSAAAKYMAMGVIEAIGGYLAGRSKLLRKDKNDEDKESLAESLLVEAGLSTMDNIPVVGGTTKAIIMGDSLRGSASADPTTDYIVNGVGTNIWNLAHDKSKEREGAQVFWDGLETLTGAAGFGGVSHRTVRTVGQMATGELEPSGPFEGASWGFYGKKKEEVRTPLTDLQDLVDGR